MTPPGDGRRARPQQADALRRALEAVLTLHVLPAARLQVDPCADAR